MTKINHVHERCLRLVHHNINSSFEDLPEIDSSSTFHQTNLQFLIAELFKVSNQIPPDYRNQIFQCNACDAKTRNRVVFKSHKIYTAN